MDEVIRHRLVAADPVGTPVMIPENYVPDLHLRLASTAAWARLDRTREIDAFGAELIDRFGPLPIEVQHLLKIVYIKALCRKANVEKLEAGPKGVVVQFRNKQFPNPAALVGYIAKQGTMAKIRPDHSGLPRRATMPTPEKRLTGAAQVMTQLAGLAK
jgi:transcription-repair coupling factor (superfamily II helicase)